MTDETKQPQAQEWRIGPRRLERLLDAPCVFCLYNGAGFYQQGTHAERCPWRDIGGVDERQDALAPVLWNLAAFSSAPTVEPPNYQCPSCGYWRVTEKVPYHASAPTPEGRLTQEDGPPQSTDEWIAYWAEQIAGDTWDVPSLETREEFKAALVVVLRHFVTRAAMRVLAAPGSGEGRELRKEPEDK